MPTATGMPGDNPISLAASGDRFPATLPTGCTGVAQPGVARRSSSVRPSNNLSSQPSRDDHGHFAPNAETERETAPVARNASQSGKSSAVEKRDQTSGHVSRSHISLGSCISGDITPPRRSTVRPPTRVQASACDTARRSNQAKVSVPSSPNGKLSPSRSMSTSEQVPSNATAPTSPASTPAVDRARRTARQTADQISAE